MSTEWPDIERAVREWIDRSAAEEWVGESDRAAFAAIESGAPSPLFENPAERPLLVGFFGGTGVGKSSLLNRLAGDSVARAGVERPTSNQVTLYVHSEVAVARLPADLPQDRTMIARHANGRWRRVAWLDCPDLDSVNEANRALTLEWLPHIDLLVYVVSPERYRDDVGWRILLERRSRQGWMFVLNRWDEGAPGQDDDWLRLLTKAGFESPLLLRTTAARPTRAPPTPDEFDRLPEAIEALVAARGIEELQRVRLRARADDLRGLLESWLPFLASGEQWAHLRRIAADRWETAQRALRDGLDFGLQQAATALAPRSAAGVQRALDALLRRSTQTTPSAPPVTTTLPALWDPWADRRTAQVVDELEVTARELGISAPAVRKRVEQCASGTRARVETQMESSLRQALSSPGTRLQRTAVKVMRALQYSLPLAAAGWIAYATVVGFHRGVTGQAEYHSPNFMVSAAMLLLVAWGGPTALRHWLTPSLQQSALDGLRQGLSLSLRDEGARLDDAVATLAATAEKRAAEAQRLIRSLVGVAARPVGGQSEWLRRVLAGHPAR